jgi:hypothetical protein
MHHLETGRGPCKVVTGMNRDTRPDYILEIKKFGKADVKNDEMIGVDENYNKSEPEDVTNDKVDAPMYLPQFKMVWKKYTSLFIICLA